MFVVPPEDPEDSSEAPRSFVLAYSNGVELKNQWMLCGDHVLAAVFVLGSVLKLDHT